MPSVTSGRVLITGANGFIARWIVKVFLDAGFIVHGTVRSASKGEALKEIFKTDRFEYVIVEDVLNDASFDKSVKDVDIVVHTASPVFGLIPPRTVIPKVTYSLVKCLPEFGLIWAEFIKPAVDGTIGILNSIIRVGTHVKRVVILSSIAAIKDLILDNETATHPVVYDERYWASASAKIVEEQGKSASNVAKYTASKMLAEKAAWDCYNGVKDTVQWDLVVLNPTYVLGPILEPFPTTNASKISGLNSFLWFILRGEPSWVNVDFWVDVRDVAEAHLKAVIVEQAGNQRFLLVSDRLVAQDLLDAVHEDDNSGEFNSLARGTPGAGKNIKPYSFEISTNKSKQILGLRYRTIRDSAKDFGRAVVKRV